MLAWLALAFLSFAAGSLWAIRRHARRQNREALDSRQPAAGEVLERPITDLRVDDVVQHDGKDWLVVGVIAFEEDGHRWRGAHVLGDTGRQWLYVGAGGDPEPTVRFLTDDTPTRSQIHGQPPELLTSGRSTYRLTRSGSATVAFTGDVGGIGQQGHTRCRWWRYLAAGEGTLLVEQWGEQYLALVGDVLPESSYELLPGS